MAKIKFSKEQFRGVLENPNSKSAAVINHLLRFEGHGAIVVGGEVQVSEPEEILTLTDVLNVVDESGKVEEFPVFIKLSDADYAKETPDTLPRNKKENEQGQMVRLKWSEYKDSTHEHRKIDGYNYVPGNSMGGIELKGSEIKALKDAKLELLSAKEYRALAAQAADVELEAVHGR